MIYLVRHGQTEWNKAGIKQGWLDSPLTSKGKRQAQLVAKFLAKYSLGEIVCSPLGRTVQTTKIITDFLSSNIPVRSFDWLREINVGDFSGQSKTWVELNYPGFYKQRTANLESKFNTRFPNGESLHDVYNRVKEPLLDLDAIHNKTNLVIVGHEGINRIIRSVLLNKDPIDYLNLHQANNEIVTLNLAESMEEVIALE